MDNNIFKRPLTNADKAALILYLLDIGLPDWTDNENDTLFFVYMALTGQDFEAAKRAFQDAGRFGWAHIQDGFEEEA